MGTGKIAHRDGKARSAEAGFTLVEVMTAMVIFTIAIVAVFSTFEFQQLSYSTQSRMAEMQQNLRMSVECLGRDLRMAGFGIPPTVNIHDNEITQRTIRPINSSSGPDEVYLMYAYDNDAFHPQVQNVNMVSGATSISLSPAATIPYVVGDRLLISDGTNGDILKITAATPTQLTLLAGPTSSYVGATLYRMRYARYFIDSSNAAHPNLMVDRRNGQAPQPIADDIEDMQFRYGLDSDNNAIVDNTVTSWPNSVSDANRWMIRQVYVELLARARMPERGWQEVRPALGDHSGPFASDGYRRRNVSVVVDVRNSGY